MRFFNFFSSTSAVRSYLFLLFWNLAVSGLNIKASNSRGLIGFFDSSRYIPYALVDLYYSNTLRKSDDAYHSPLFQNYNALGQLGVNQIILGFQLKSKYYSANLGLHSGTYLADAYSEEPEILRYIRYADIGFSLTKTGNLWLNAGIFKAPYGIESPVPTNNWTLTYPIISSESPFYQTGARLSWSGWKNWQLAIWVLNGWGRIKKVVHNSLPAWNLSIEYNKPKKFELTYNNFIGTDDPDSSRRMRYYQEMHGIFTLNNSWSIAFMLAFGMQQQYKNASTYDYWSGGEIVARYLI